MRAAIACLIFLAVGAEAGAVPGRWNPKAPENSQISPSFSYATVEPVLRSIGARYQRSGSAGEPVLLVSFSNGRKAIITLGACNDSGSACRSLNVQSSWTPISNASRAEVAAAIEGFNQRYAFAKAFLTADDKPAMQRYLTADYGFIRGDLAINLLVFSTQVERFAKDVLAPLGRQ